MAEGAGEVVKFFKSVGADLAVDIFLDGKFYDIPTTVGKATAVVANLGVVMINVHASAGIDAMFAAVDNKKSAKVLAVTVLTTREENDAFLDFGAPIKAKVLHFARNAKLAGVDGIICSPQELEFLGKRRELKGLLRVTPGVRPQWASKNDQERAMTPGEAVSFGADYLVIGRPITRPPKEIGTPVQAIQSINEEIEAALAAMKS